MKVERKYEFRISKYNPKYRENGIFLKNEWTSFNDIGKAYDGKVLCYSEYEQIEKRYLSLIQKLCILLNTSQMQIADLEDPFSICTYVNGSTLNSIDDIAKVAKGCLREQYWCRLNSDRLSFLFGYDFYLYVCSPLDYQHMEDLVLNTGLFIEVRTDGMFSGSLW